MTEEKKLAILIDSDNVSAKYAQFILQEAAKFGELTYKRIYGDWEKGGNGWHYPALNNSIMPVQQTAYITGKNATDFSMIIDAMDILYSGNVDGFVLVTSDSDFTRLAIRLREAGKLVIGIGEVKTPLPFTSSCHQFIYLNQVCDQTVHYDEKAVRQAVLDFVSENDDGKLDLLKISAFLTSKFGSIDYSAYGFNRFSNFIDSFPELRRNNTFVTPKHSTKKFKRSTDNLPSEAEIVDVIVGYLNRKQGDHEDISRVEQYLTAALGKIDFSRFGSKRFAKFLDKQSAIVRKSTSVYLAENAPAPKNEHTPAQEPTAETANKTPAEQEAPAENSPTETDINRVIIDYLMGIEGKKEKVEVLGNNVTKALGKVDYSQFGAKTFARYLDKQKAFIRKNMQVQLSPKTAVVNAAYNPLPTVSAPTAEKSEPKKAPTEEEILDAVVGFLKMSDNGKARITDVEKQVENSFGKVDYSRFGAKTFAKFLDKQSKLLRTNTSVSLSDKQEAHPASEPTSPQAAEPKPKRKTSKSEAPDNPEKAELNAVKREIQIQTVQHENSISLAALGKILRGKYGSNYLKDIGAITLKQLVTAVAGVKVSGNSIRIDEDFINRTEQIEQFVCDFVAKNGKPSIKSLSTQIKKNFEGFDFTDYGYARFSDFINAIDGVRADGYYVEAE